MRSTLKYDIMFPSSGGLISMKTKIIYISGNEVFNMADIRAAFEEVRSTLGLGSDTVMFGVPVDNDDALSHDNADNIETSVEENTVDLNVDSNTEDVDFTEVADEEIKPEQEPEIIAPVVPEEAEIKEKVVKKTTTKKSKSRDKEKTEPEMSAAAETEPVKNDEKIIPILSILAAKNEPETDTEESAVPLKEDEEGKILYKNDANYNNLQNKLCFDMQLTTYHQDTGTRSCDFERTINLNDRKHRHNMSLSSYDRNGEMVRNEEISSLYYLKTRFPKVFYNTYKSDLKVLNEELTSKRLHPDDIQFNLE